MENENYVFHKVRLFALFYEANIRTDHLQTAPKIDKIYKVLFLTKLFAYLSIFKTFDTYTFPSPGYHFKDLKFPDIFWLCV